MDSDKEARIRERAYEIWVREGRPHGRDAEHWRKAEAEITAGEQAAATSKPPADVPGDAPLAPGPAAGAAPTLRRRRTTAKSAQANPPGTSESGAAGRPGRKTPGS